MKNVAMFAYLAAMLNGLVASDAHSHRRSIRTKQEKINTFKPASSVGFRGKPRSYSAPGSMAAPTIDQVRDRERKYGQKIHVKRGLMFFASDGIMWTADEAAKRQAA